MKILTVITNHGNKNDRFRDRIIQEYQSMDHDVDIVVLSNIPRNLGPGIEVRVGLVTNNPWSLPYGHKQIFADCINDYDLFIYTEDDILLTQKHIDDFLEVTRILPDDVIAGFLPYEEDPDGIRYSTDMHSFYRWIPNSVCEYGGETFAFYTNEHSALFILTQEQLRKVIESGGFLVQPHEGKYDMLVSAATDPYAQCGLTKLICISRINDFLLHHLPDLYYKYMGRSNLHILKNIDMQIEIDALCKAKHDPTYKMELISPMTKFETRYWDKLFYNQPHQECIVELVPDNTSRILSVGCGDGKIEKILMGKGHEVVGIPLNLIIGSLAENKGIPLTLPDFNRALDGLSDQKFDYILFIDLLHHLEDPEKIISRFLPLLNNNGCIILSVTNFKCISLLNKKYFRQYSYFINKHRKSFNINGIHYTHVGMLKRWHKYCGMRIIARDGIFSKKLAKINKWTFGIFFSLLCTDIIIKSTKS